MLGRPAAVDMIHALKPEFRAAGSSDAETLGSGGRAPPARKRLYHRLMILSIKPDERHVAERLARGRGCLPSQRRTPPAIFLEAIRYVQEGGVYITPLLGGAVMHCPPHAVPAEDPLAPLSAANTRFSLIWSK